MDSFIFAFNALMPIIILVIIGYILKKIGFLKSDFLSMANKFCFRVALPVLLFKNVYDSDFNNINWILIGYAVGFIVLTFFVGLLLVVLFIKDPKKKGVLLQCTFRSNFAIIGVSLASMIFTDAFLSAQAQAIAALISAFSIPVFNILAVISLSVFVHDEDAKKTGVKDILINICKNPLIIGVVVGLVFSVARLVISKATGNAPYMYVKQDLPFIYTSVKNLAAIASPLALIVLGGQFEFSAVKSLIKEITFGVVSRLVVVPLLGIGIAILINNVLPATHKFTPGDFASMIALFGSPVAVSSAIMAGEMKNDGELAGQLVIWTTLLSTITIFITIVILRNLNLLG